MTVPDHMAQFVKLHQERLTLELREPVTAEVLQRIAELKQQEMALISATGSPAPAADTATPAEVDEMAGSGGRTKGDGDAG